MKKKAIEVGFAWIFAILVGAFIIFLAIYGVSKLIQNQEYVVGTETAKKLSIIFDPMEIGMASGKVSIAKFSSNTRIYNRCFSDSLFGKQKFSVSSMSLGKWSKEGGEISVTNKYIFSEQAEEGGEFSLFALPFNFPYKVSELIFFSGKKYCFVSPPNFVEEDVSGLNLKNVYISNELTNKTCTPGDVRVCFNEDCEINIIGLCQGYGCESDFDYGYAKKDGKQFYYSGNLVYAAIFSEPELYECNVKRLMKRASQIAYLYSDEANFLAQKGCGSEISNDLLDFGNSLNNAKSSAEIMLLQEKAKQLEIKNSALECEIW